MSAAEAPTREWTVDSFRAASPVETGWLESEIAGFVARHSAGGGRPLACVTSGGTTIPLERNCVRFIDNFSRGARGALSVEEFVGAGYAVIFLFRTGSLLPFLAPVQEEVRSAFERDAAGAARVGALTGALAGAAQASARYEAVKDRLLFVPYDTLFQYLAYLEVAARGLATAGPRALFYLAAAVSDYFQPWGELAEHKISGPGPLTLRLERTPKMLGALRRDWAPVALTVSFKLETDHSVLLDKAGGAIRDYGVHLVVANELHSRKDCVSLVWAAGDALGGEALRGAQPDPRAGAVVEDVHRGDTPRIETLIVQRIVQGHARHIEQGGGA